MRSCVSSLAAKQLVSLAILSPSLAIANSQLLTAIPTVLFVKIEARDAMKSARADETAPPPVVAEFPVRVACGGLGSPRPWDTAPPSLAELPLKVLFSIEPGETERLEKPPPRPLLMAW